VNAQKSMTIPADVTEDWYGRIEVGKGSGDGYHIALAAYTKIP